MRSAVFSLIGVTLLAQLCFAGPRRYEATGLILAIDGAGQTVTVSHQSIPGFMQAMAMPFHVRSPKLLKGLHAGDTVVFTLSVGRNASWVDEIRVTRFDSPERDPALAGRLQAMDSVMGNLARPLTVGEKAEFLLTNQEGVPVSLSEFAGKVVVIDFIYTRCPLPDYCFRLSNNFLRLQKRFAGDTRLVLLTISFDPAHDTPEELARYARIWNADPLMWHFLTGDPAEVQRVSALFGMGYWPDEGVFIHSLHTAILDREGKLVANLEGNRFTAAQLGDLVQALIGPVR